MLTSHRSTWVLGITLAGLLAGCAQKSAPNDATRVTNAPPPPQPAQVSTRPTPQIPANAPNAPVRPNASKPPIATNVPQAPGAPTGGKGLTVGFSQIGAESEWRTAETESIRGEAIKRGIDLKFADAQQKQENQIKALNTFIAQKVDAIILAPVVETGWEPVLREARAAHVPVFLADRAIQVSDPSLYVTLVSPDVVEEGRMAGRWMAKSLDGKGRIVELQGTTGSSPANDRAKGFREAITKYPGLKITRSQSGDFTRTRGKEVMEAFLRSSPKAIDAVYAHNDDMALGAIQAIQEAGLKPGKDMKIISIDAVRGAFLAMKDGTLNATVECNPLLGPTLFDAIEAHRAGKTLPKKISLKERLYEQHEAAALLPTRQY